MEDVVSFGPVLISKTESITPAGYIKILIKAVNKIARCSCYVPVSPIVIYVSGSCDYHHLLPMAFFLVQKCVIWFIGLNFATSDG